MMLTCPMTQFIKKAQHMKHKIFLLAVIVPLILLHTACSEEELEESHITDSTTELSDLDLWLREMFTYPYNVEVKYKWDDYETDLTKNLVPPYEENVQPLMDVMDKVWVKCYEEEGGDVFLKSYIPKMIYLVGSPGVNPEGTIVQGTAEAGRKIVLYEVNKFEATNSERINRFFHVMHHEFAHILHQTTLYDTETFEDISSGSYRSDWYNVSEDSVALYLGLGFVSPYAMSSRDEDFVEVIAYMLTRTQSEWEDYITQEGADSVLLRRKEAIVSDYFLNIWDIDIYGLQALIAESIEKVVGENATAEKSPFVYTSSCAQLCSNCSHENEEE